MFVARDSEGVSNPWLMFYSGKWVWGPKRDMAHKFATEEGALQTGMAAMPSLVMADRVIVEPA